MTMQEAQEYSEQVSGWEIFEQDETLRIRKQFKFSTYMSGINFINKIAKLAEEEGHHPNLEVVCKIDGYVMDPCHRRAF